MKITENRTEDTILLTVEGRVDTNTSPQLQERLLKAFQKGSRVILDLEQVEYVSSAGLRALLIGQKTANSKKGSMKLIHVQEAVQEVLDLSGFSAILTIEQAVL